MKQGVAGSRDAFERLSGIKTRLGAGLEITAEEENKILRERARILAREQPDAASEEVCSEVLEFSLARERYAIESRHIREVFAMKELTVLPCVPPFIIGIINVRGQLLPVMDIKKFFHLPEGGLTNLNKVIIVKIYKTELGILSDEIVGIRNLVNSELQSPPAPVGIGAEYLKGITDERLIVLDVEKIVSDKQIIVHEEVEI